MQSSALYGDDERMIQQSQLEGARSNPAESNQRMDYDDISDPGAYPEGDAMADEPDLMKDEDRSKKEAELLFWV